MLSTVLKIWAMWALFGIFFGLGYYSGVGDAHKAHPDYWTVMPWWVLPVALFALLGVFSIIALIADYFLDKRDY